jgi:hypothetical protein
MDNSDQCVLQNLPSPFLKDVEPFQLRLSSVSPFPDPSCISELGPDFLWLDAVKLRYVLEDEASKHKNMFCHLMIEELHELKRQSNMPYLSKSDLLKELESPRFGLLPMFREELDLLSSNLNTRSEVVAQAQRLSGNLQNHFIGEGGNYFCAVGDETSVSVHLKESWKRKLEAKVHYSVVNSERERSFHDRIIQALERLHSQSRLDYLHGKHWRMYWDACSFEQCQDVKVRGMIKNIALEAVALNPAISGKQFSVVADEAKAAPG